MVRGAPHSILLGRMMTMLAWRRRCRHVPSARRHVPSARRHVPSAVSCALLILQKAEEEELMMVVVVVMTEEEEEEEDGTCAECKERKRSMWRQRRLC